ncbi:MAG: hypothetical protein ONB23_09450 [candidate division KSB1 bacterium]|nr:hypothetical protein [candidate division KSB1 bacterium]
MAWIRRQWSAGDADNWTKEDWIAVILSSLSYVGILIGVSLAFLLRWEGFLLVAVTVVVTWLLFWIIDPKLSVISRDYERKQREYIERLEKIARWEGE